MLRRGRQPANLRRRVYEILEQGAAGDLENINAIGVGSTATSALDIVMSSDELRTAMEDATPLRRLGHVDDIASAILYLVSPAGAYVTGKILEVDGGLQSPNLEFPLPDL